jgi:hypothetical protein
MPEWAHLATCPLCGGPTCPPRAHDDGTTVTVHATGAGGNAGTTGDSNWQLQHLLSRRAGAAGSAGPSNRPARAHCWPELPEAFFVASRVPTATVLVGMYGGKGCRVCRLLLDGLAVPAVPTGAGSSCQVCWRRCWLLRSHCPSAGYDNVLGSCQNGGLQAEALFQSGVGLLPTWMSQNKYERMSDSCPHVGPQHSMRILGSCHDSVLIHQGS